MERIARYVWQPSHRRSSAGVVPYMGDEADQPYMGTGIAETKSQFPEAAIVRPAIIEQRRLGVFDRDGDSNEVFYAPIEAYEGRHRYDPAFEWEPREERHLVRKVGC